LQICLRNLTKKKIAVEEDIPEDDIVIPEDSNMTDVQEEIRKLKQELMEHDAKAFEQEKSLERQEEDLLEKALKLQNDLENERQKTKELKDFKNKEVNSLREKLSKLKNDNLSAPDTET